MDVVGSTKTNDVCFLVPLMLFLNAHGVNSDIDRYADVQQWAAHMWFEEMTMQMKRAAMRRLRRRGCGGGVRFRLMTVSAEILVFC